MTVCLALGIRLRYQESPPEADHLVTNVIGCVHFQEKSGRTGHRSHVEHKNSAANSKRDGVCVHVGT